MLLLLSIFIILMTIVLLVVLFLYSPEDFICIVAAFVTIGLLYGFFTDFAYIPLTINYIKKDFANFLAIIFCVDFGTLIFILFFGD